MWRTVLVLPVPSEWVKVFDPRGSGLFVTADEPPPVGADALVDLTVGEGGPRVILRGRVLWTRVAEDGSGPSGCGIGLVPDDREKVNFLNGYVRGGLINRRERRRLPLRLPARFAGLEGPEATHTRDVNEDGAFVLTPRPLPEESQLTLELDVPGEADPLALPAVVWHTVIPEDEDVPGMGVRFRLDEARAAAVAAVIDRLESAFLAGRLPEPVIS